MSNSRPNDDRLEELLADQALFGLTPEERLELEQLLATTSIDAEELDRIAALTALAFQTDSGDALPADLQKKILETSEAYLPVAKTRKPSVTSKKPLPTAGSSTRPPNSPAASSRREVVAWLISASLLIALAIVWWGGPWRSRVAISLVDSRAKMLQSESDVLQTAWSTTDDPNAQGVSGDIVWSNRLQRGFMRFQGLPKNNAALSQYQLWIFDGQQDQRYPIDGGVFDVDSATGDVVVPIHAKLQVMDPQMFAITIEKAGGVVVSNRERLILIAKTTGKAAG